MSKFDNDLIVSIDELTELLKDAFIKGALSHDKHCFDLQNWRNINIDMNLKTTEIISNFKSKVVTNKCINNINKISSLKS